MVSIQALRKLTAFADIWKVRTNFGSISHMLSSAEEPNTSIVFRIFSDARFCGDESLSKTLIMSGSISTMAGINSASKDPERAST